MSSEAQGRGIWDFYNRKLNLQYEESCADKMCIDSAGVRAGGKRTGTARMAAATPCLPDGYSRQPGKRRPLEGSKCSRPRLDLDQSLTTSLTTLYQSYDALL